MFYIFSNSNLITLNLSDHTRQKIVICRLVNLKMFNLDYITFFTLPYDSHVFESTSKFLTIRCTSYSWAWAFHS